MAPRLLHAAFVQAFLQRRDGPSHRVTLAVTAATDHAFLERVDLSA